MPTIALYNRHGQRLLTLQDAQEKGHGSAVTLKQRIRRGQISGYKVGPLWLVREDVLLQSRQSCKRQ